MTEQNGQRHGMSLIRKILYWEGMWYEDPEPDLEFYLQYFIPWLARLLVKHRYLRLAVSLLRQLLPWFLISLSVCQIFFLFPMGMYAYWHNKFDVLSNFYLILLSLMMITGMATLYFQKKQMDDLLKATVHFEKQEEFDNEEQKTILNRTHVFCHKATKYIHTILVPLVNILVALMGYFVWLPERRLQVREWYPFDAGVTPVYEIVLFIRILQELLLFLVSNGLVSAVGFAFIYIKSYFDILLNRITNIKTIAITRIKKRTVKKSQTFTYSSETLHEYHTTVQIDHLPLLRPLYGRDTSESGARVGPTGDEATDKARETAAEEVTPELVDAEMKVLLAEIVEQHVKLTGFVGKMASLLNVYLIVMFLVNTLSVATTFILITTTKDAIGIKEITFVLYTIEIMQLYMLHNFLADRITDQSAAIAQAMYNIDWLGASTGFKKSMMIIMTRANAPLQIKPTGLDPLSVKNFSEVLRIGYKMLSTLSNMSK